MQNNKGVQLEIKKIIKRAIGTGNTDRLKHILNEYRFKNSVRSGSVGQIHSKYEYDYYGIEGYHVFFGYYDLQQTEGEKLLVHVLRENSISGKDSIEIAYVDPGSHQFYAITTSYAWSWQQGSRLRWSNKNQGCIYFNNFDGKDYCTELWDVGSRKLVRKIGAPLYDICPGEQMGFSVNFSRLQRLRPGYGYTNLPDETANDYAPENDGLYVVDLIEDTKKNFVSIRQLADENGVDTDGNCYINHVSVCPGGKWFIFFFIWAKENDVDRKVWLYLGDYTDMSFKCIEKDATVSHYCWEGTEKLVYTSTDGHYYTYDLRNGIKTQLSSDYVKEDGHPNWIKENQKILSDTYRKKNGFQNLFMMDDSGNNYEMIAELFCDPRFYDEYRCDLHPRVSKNDITVDSTFLSGRRCVVRFNRP